MNDRDAKVGEMRQWAVEMLQRPRTSNTEGAAALNRRVVDVLQSCREIGVAPPEELVALVARQLDIDGRVRNAPRLKIEQMTAAMALARDSTISDNKIAELCGVSRPTVARWKKDPRFESLKVMFKMDGVLKEVVPWQQKLSR
jgi:hypothetical protein